ncbi:ShlB/FhaC/HecB family hemolysin secretion/activation protein [Aquabacterium sp. A7-Y]|uniref:ShlB/FhaC/HecB family hemolysin secretion/activation protein n=1 Tax=Aquabacterium sp. A7-Y TaxID=1349605 RepID=UPI00223E28E7|nr:ShlB/FhaC/HecB family hemolysin secretion/activation protein [Aquabacterium sp. A7-Y]MCW7538642.1 ShlB/FhaC/HecB family hemolysin secretion/activation protein [Aquabacterium sp. A7-Y]
MPPTLPPSRLALLTAALAGVAVSAPAQTAAPPDAGQTLRELQQRPQPPRPGQAPSLQVPPDADTGADPGQRFAVKAVQIEGNVRIPTQELQPLATGLVGRDVTLGELREAAKRITARYRERGFVVARAFVPAQEVRDGVVRITVLEGRLTSSTVQNGSIVKTERLQAMVAAQRLNGRTIHSKETDRTLLLLADLPAVGKVSGLLKPGKDVGSSELFITAEPGKTREGSVSVDNYGNRYTGQARLNGQLDLNSPLRLGDRLSLRATVTEEALLYGRAAFDLPANNHGLRVGAAVSSSRYELGKEFEGLDATGTAHTAGLYATYPVQRGLNSNVWLTGALDYRKLKDEVDSTDSRTRKSTRSATLEVYGDLSDALAGGGYSTWRVTGVLGDLGIDSGEAQVADQAGPRTEGGYRKLQLALTRLQAITPRTTAFVALSGQAASKNLDSSEKFVIGGIYGIRAYPQGEGVGDEGWMANLEVRQDFTQGLQGSVFYDHGHVKFNHRSYAAGSNEQTLKGYGLGLGMRYQAFHVKATVAWRKGQAALTAPDRRPRGWITAGWSF